MPTKHEPKTITKRSRREKTHTHTINTLNLHRTSELIKLFKYNGSIEHYSSLKCKTNDQQLLFSYYSITKYGLQSLSFTEQTSASAEVWNVILLKFMFVFVSDLLFFSCQRHSQSLSMKNRIFDVIQSHSK